MAENVADTVRASAGKGFDGVFSVLVTPDSGQAEFPSHLAVSGSRTVVQVEIASRLQKSTYVLYDPDATDQCQIDVDRIEREFGRDRKGMQRVAIPASDVTSTPSGDADVAKLAELAALRSSGALTDKEFAAAKARLLGLPGPE